MNTPDLTTYHLIHRAIRQSTTRLTAAVSGVVEEERRERGRQLARWYAGFEGELHMHHTVEDDFFFPALFQHVPALRGYLDRIDEEHHYLGDLIVDTRNAILEISNPMTPFTDAVTGAVKRAAELEELMAGHLDFEDAEILPLFTRHMDAAEYDEVEGKAMANPKVGELKFTVPWLMANANGEEQTLLLDNAPFMMKVLWIATRRGYDRLATAALGDVVPAPVMAVAS
jgi:hemerythrin-like domain-containing protein